MKKIFVLSMLISFAMICSCQKQDSAAEQLAQRKAELDAREKALDEREKASTEKEKPTVSARTILPDLQSRGQVRDPAQVKAERDRRLQQLSPDVQALMPDPSRMKAEKDERDRMIQERLGQRQRRLEELQRLRMSPAVRPEAAAFPGAVASPEAEATSPSPSPTPQ
jgi:hypothetical protein